MAKIDDLNSAISELQVTADAVVAKLNEGGTLDPQLEAATAAVVAVSAKLNAAITPAQPPA